MTTHARKRTTRFGTWNIRSINGKEIELVEEVKKYNINILGITETKKKGQGYESLGNHHKLIYSGVDTKERAQAGVALILTNDLFESSDFRCVNERLLEVNIELTDKNIKIIVAYGPNEDETKEKREEFYHQLQSILDITKSNQEIIILGDLNARVGNNQENGFGAIGKEGENIESPNGELLLDICIHNNLKIANTFFKHKNIHKWTRVCEERNERSIIDYIIVSNRLFYNTNNVRVKRGAEIYSDHFLLVGEFNLNLNIKTKVPKQKETKRYKIKIEEFQNNDNKIKYQKKIKRKFTGRTRTEELEEIWSIYKEAITESASEVCGMKIIGGTNKRTAWWNDRVKLKVKEKKEAWKKYLASKTEKDLELYKTKRKEAKNEVKLSKQTQWEIFGEKLEQNYRENQKLFWGAVKRCRRGNNCPIKHVKDKQGEVVKDNDKILDVWKEYFQNLHNSNDMNHNVDIDSPNNNCSDNDENEEEITMTELINALKKIKIGKAAGIDGIYPEMIVHQGAEANKVLLKVCQIAYKTKMVPKDWNMSIIIPIHKSGSSMQCENYRGISLLSVPGKVYARIIESRLRNKVEDNLLEHQSGFRPGRSVQDHIFALRQVSESTYRYNKEFHACFVDLQKAFDSVQRNQVWKALEEHEVNTKLIEAIKSFYIEPESAVRIAGKLSNKFKIDVGVRQGCILSPLLFIILMDSISKKVDKGMKPLEVGMWKLKPVKLTMLSFADDLIIFGKTQKDLQQNVNILNRELKKRCLVINAKKTKSMVIGREQSKHQIKLDQEVLEQVDSYKYLGVIIRSNCSLKEEINQRIGKATKVYGQLGYSFISKRELTTKTKMSIFNSIYCPTLIYGSESWSLDNRDKSRLQASEMKFLRRSIGKTKRDKIRNTRIREEVKTESLEKKIEKNQLRWFGHVNRMDDSRIPKQMLECRQQGKLPRGRPKTTWQEVITETIKKKGCKFVDAKRKTLDRNQWRKFVYDA